VFNDREALAKLLAALDRVLDEHDLRADVLVTTPRRTGPAPGSRVSRSGMWNQYAVAFASRQPFATIPTYGQTARRQVVDELHPAGDARPQLQLGRQRTWRSPAGRRPSSASC
jgi:hypothetical protein